MTERIRLKIREGESAGSRGEEGEGRRAGEKEQERRYGEKEREWEERGEGMGYGRHHTGHTAWQEGQHTQPYERKNERKEEGKEDGLWLGGESSSSSSPAYADGANVSNGSNGMYGAAYGGYDSYGLCRTHTAMYIGSPITKSVTTNRRGEGGGDSEGGGGERGGEEGGEEDGGEEEGRGSVMTGSFAPSRRRGTTRLSAIHSPTGKVVLRDFIYIDTLTHRYHW